jgi:hypothetical protein
MPGPGPAASSSPDLCEVAGMRGARGARDPWGEWGAWGAWDAGDFCFDWEIVRRIRIDVDVVQNVSTLTRTLSPKVP